MFPWAPVISAGASLLGGLVSARGAGQAADRSEAFSRDMYEYALLNGPRLEMEGLRAAGINPMLRYGTGGQGTPVSMPTMNFPNQAGGLGDGIAGAASSAFGTYKMEQEVAESRARTVSMLEKLPAELKSIGANTSLTVQQRATEERRIGQIWSETFLNEARTQLTIEEVRTVDARIRQMDASAFASVAAAAAAQANAALTNAALSRAQYDEAFYDSWFGNVMRGVGLTVDSLTGGSTPVVPNSN